MTKKLSAHGIQARELLAQGKSPKEIADALGLKTYGWVYRLQSGSQSSKTKTKAKLKTKTKVKPANKTAQKTSSGIRSVWVSPALPMVAFGTAMAAAKAMGDGQELFELPVLS
jgi:hypothetical protein